MKSGRKFVSLALAVLLLVASSIQLASAQDYPTGFKVSIPTGHTLLRTSGKSSLYSVQTAGYDKPINLINLFGSHYEIGFAYGAMLATESTQNFEALFNSAVPKIWEQDVLFAFLDWQYTKYLSQQLPQEFIDEISGIDAGASSVGVNGLGQLIKRGIVVSNFPGDIEHDIEYLLEGELVGFGQSVWSKMTPKAKDDLMQAARSLRARFGKYQCSHMAVWGSRTDTGDIYSSRNLDWAPDSGIANNKVVAVYHPDGEYAHATFGFAGLIGSLTGMSAQGLTVAESGLDVKEETFLGFTWTLRLRHIMGHATNLAEAKTIWENTNNTLGMNHMFASANDNAAFAVETMRGYTAYFGPNDPREAARVYTDPTTGVQTHLGAPAPEVIYRTNHAYDPTIVPQMVYTSTPGEDTVVRYMIIAQSFASLQAAGPATAGIMQVLNITSIVGDKGSGNYDSFFSCEGEKVATQGSNILSVAYNPGKLTAYAAWEEGTGTSRSPAACGTYVELDMSPWFASTPGPSTQ